MCACVGVCTWACIRSGWLETKKSKMLDTSLFPHSSKGEVPAFLPPVCLESVSRRLPETLALSAAPSCLAPPSNLIYRAPSIKQPLVGILGLPHIAQQLVLWRVHIYLQRDSSLLRNLPSCLPLLVSPGYAMGCGGRDEGRERGGAGDVFWAVVLVGDSERFQSPTPLLLGVICFCVCDLLLEMVFYKWSRTD